MKKLIELILEYLLYLPIILVALLAIALFVLLAINGEEWLSVGSEWLSDFICSYYC